MRMNLHLFEGGHSVTVYADAGVTTAVADKTSDVAKDEEVTLTITLETGKMVDEIEVIAGGVVIDMDDYTFTMGEADVVLYVKTKSTTGHSVTVYADAGAVAVADKTSEVAKDAEVTLTITLGAGKMVDEIEVIAGGVVIDMDDYTFTMGQADVVLYVKTKSTTAYYKVTEECVAIVNDSKQIFHKNTVLVLTPNGVPHAVSVESGGATATLNDAVQSLIDQGILVQI